MISFIRGIIMEKLEESLIIDVSGLGYEVLVTPRVYQRARTNEEALIFTHLQIREDAHVLYGFADQDERDLFRQLINVNGVGPKTGMAILAALKPDELIRAIVNEDYARLKVPGVGPKTAKRLVLELKPIMKGMETASVGPETGTSNLHVDVSVALEQLGYTAQEIKDALDGTDLSAYTLSEAVKIVLKNVQK